MSGYALSQLIRFGGSLITTRLLAPELFGIMAVVNSVATLVALFSNVGLNLSVIRSERGDDPAFLKTVFTIKFLQSCLLALVIASISQIAELANALNITAENTVYASPDFTAALLIVALSVFILGWRSIQIELSTRNQNVARQTLLEISAQAISLSFIIYVARENPSIYALAFANVVSASVSVIGSYLIFSRKTAGFGWDRPAVKEIFSFGKWILGSTAIVGISNNIDRLLFGFLLTSGQLGVYSVAMLIFNAMDTVFKRINIALLPAISRIIRERKHDLSSVYYRIRLFRDAAIIFPTCMVLVNGDLIIKLLYDGRYADAGYYLQLLSVAHIIDCFLFKNQVLITLGESKIQFEIAVRRLVALILFIPAGYYIGGITGILLALSARRLIASWLIFSKFKEYCAISWLKEIRTLGIITVAILFWLIVRAIAMHYTT